MSHLISRRYSITGRHFAGLGFILLSLAACSQGPHQVAHRGLSPDGYGFVQNGPTLAPPEHLLQHQATTPTSGANPQPVSPAATAQP